YIKEVNMNKQNTNEVSLETLEINLEQAQVMKDDELKTVTGGYVTSPENDGAGTNCRLHN
ncbi:MAG: hypothetical protein ACI8WB_003383, partial [Phenylobacterium sp.]